MEDRALAQVLEQMEDEEVEAVRLQFTDINGTLKSVAVTPARLRSLGEEPLFVDGSFLAGRDGEEGVELLLKPDLSTCSILPWKGYTGKVARLYCSLCQEDGTPFPEDSRAVLAEAERRAEAEGYRLSVRPECEFFLFHTDDDGQPTVLTHERAGYLEASPVDLGESARREMVHTLEEMGVTVEASRHEISPGQHGIDLGRMGLLEAADGIATFRFVVRTVAKRHGLHATFMPKPQEGVNGSGMHINMSLTDGMGRNLFEDKDDPAGLSTLAYQFMAGILYHMKEMVLLTNPLVNSYKRLIPGYDAPNYIAWSIHSNRSALIRIPSARGYNTRVELRCPDSSANPYLALAACLAAGLDGIEKQMTPPPSVNRNIYAMSREEKEAAGIEALPETLKEAMNFFEASDFMKEVLGEHIFTKYLEAKEREWKAFRAHVTDWEVGEYLYKY